MKHKVHHGSKKKGHSKRRKKHQSQRSLSGVSRMSPMVQDIQEDGKAIGGILLGVVAGNMGAKLLTKLLKADAADAGMIKKLMVPVAITGAGFATAHFMKKDPFLKNVGFGVGVAGGAKIIAVILKKDLLAGIDEDEAAATEAKFYNESSEQLRLLAAQNNFAPNLNGTGENVTSELYHDNQEDMVII